MNQFSLSAEIAESYFTFKLNGEFSLLVEGIKV